MIPATMMFIWYIGFGAIVQESRRVFFCWKFGATLGDVASSSNRGIHLRNLIDRVVIAISKDWRANGGLDSKEKW